MSRIGYCNGMQIKEGIENERKRHGLLDRKHLLYYRTLAPLMLISFRSTN